jgi:hypothetical protein
MAPTTQPTAGGSNAAGSAAGSTPAVSPPSRPLRTAVAVSVATAIGAVGHLLAGGSLSPGALAVALGAAIVPAWLSSDRERSWAWIAVLQVGNQQIVHVALSAAGTGEPIMAAHALMPAHALAGPAAAVFPHDLPMLLAHVLAGLITAVALRAGERSMWTEVRRFAARVRRRLRQLIDLAPASPPRAASSIAVRPDHGFRPRQRLLRHSVVLRGPPPARS